MSDVDLKTIIKDKYAALARQVSAPGTGRGCCSTSSGCGGSDPITSDLYTDEQRDALPTEAVKASLGCGNPTALAELNPGETVLDLGSGGGIDVLLSARRVGPTGKVYGLDMTDDMVALARENQRKAGVTNVVFLKGDIEQMPLPDGSVDVVISNCVINLATDKDRVLGEAFRVLKPGGRFAVSDIIAREPVPAALRHDVESWSGCVAGALEESEYRAKLARAGFTGIGVEPWRVYGSDVMSEGATGCCGDQGERSPAYGTFASAFIRARKPAA